MFLHDCIAKTIELILLFFNLTFKLIDLSVQAVHPMHINIIPRIVLGVVERAKLTKIHQIGHSIIRKTLAITIRDNMILLVFNTLLVCRLHVHFVILVILEILVMGILLLLLIIHPLVLL